MSTIRIRIIDSDGATDILPTEIINYREYPLSHDVFITRDGIICNVEKVECDNQGIFYDVSDVTADEERTLWP